MNHLQMIGAGRAAKIAPLNQCHRKPPLGRIPRSTRAKDSTPNHDEIEFAICQARQITFHDWFSSRCASRSGEAWLRALMNLAFDVALCLALNAHAIPHLAVYQQPEPIPVISFALAVAFQHLIDW